MWKSFSKKFDNEVPQVLETLDIPGIAKYIQSDACENIFIMAGAGISTAAGIPDFRSPDTGLYANLARLNLPYPEAVFDINFFRRNPRPFYTLAHELAPGKYRPTLTHSFIKLLQEKELLHTCFTQNIDTLERRSGVSENKIVEAHGSFAGQHCIDCESSYPDDKMKDMIESQQIARCLKLSCDGLVKPDIVFFGESLPNAFHRTVPQLRKADLLIVMGTSLTVQPFASLTQLVPEDCPRLLLNLDNVGDFGTRTNDVICLMKCDHAVRELCKLLDWEKDLDRLWEKTADSVIKVSQKDGLISRTLQDEVDKLTKEVDELLIISEEKTLHKENENLSLEAVNTDPNEKDLVTNIYASESTQEQQKNDIPVTSTENDSFRVQQDVNEGLHGQDTENDGDHSHLSGEEPERVKL